MADGLFGPQMTQEQYDYQQGLKNAAIPLAQKLGAMNYAAGSGLTRGVGSLFGVDMQSPELARATKLRELGAKYGTTTAEALDKIAADLQATDPQMAMQVAEKANELRLASSKIASEQALTAQRMREKAAADPLQKLLQEGKYTPESIATYQQSGNIADLKLMDKDKKSDLAILLTERAQLDPVKNKEQYDLYSAKIKKLVSGKGLAGDIAEGLAPMVSAIAGAQAKKAGEAGGTAVGKDVAAIQGKYTALSSVNDALDVVDRGIYAGGYGPLGEAVAKYSSGAVGSKQRLVNTEEFRAYIGDVVIPRLQEFGGNDSVEELKYLRSVMAGETTLEEKSIKRILDKAAKKIRAGIQRLEAQQKAIKEGKPLPTGQLGAKQYTTKSGVTYTKED